MLSRLRWPLPALMAWACAWLAYTVLQDALPALWPGPLAQAGGLVRPVSLGLACALGVALSLLGQTWWRRLAIAAGFPISLAVSGASLPAWGWLAPLALLLLIYPVNAWRDAPLFPTPADALQRLAASAPLPEGALVLDAGCGLGHALVALRRAYPKAQLHGIEWSWPLRALCALRCPWARVRQGDIWRADWGPYDLVYLFQRPESMPRAVIKARAEMRPGSWLVSLEFEAREIGPHQVLRDGDAKPVWLYRAPFAAQQPAPRP